MILVFLALLFILKFNYPIVFIDYLIGFVSVLCLVSAAFTLWTSRSVHLEVDTPARRIHEGEEISVTVRIVTPDFFGKMRAAVRLRNLQRGSSVTEKRVLSEHRSELCFSGMQTGTIEITVPYVEVFGVFGVLRVRRRNVFKARVNVYPNDGPAPDRHVRLSYVPGGAETLNVKGDDLTEIYEVRPLQEGDDLRHVHRQLSARFDEYMIKVGSDTRRRVYNYYIESGLDFKEMSFRIAQMFTLRKNVEKEDDALMAAIYRGTVNIIAFSSQLYDLADRIYEDYLPSSEKTGGNAA